jgi:hypothetical protein
MEQYIEITDLGNKFYYSDKEMTIAHREDGPAIEMQSGCKKWYLNDIEYTEEDLNKKTNPAKTININGREFTVEELNSLIAKAQ